ncbi:MAG: TetR family transcriptional regulator [Bacilli bacterium]|nr:TetR family transcriptional regulator [Bacilli bacterium]
MKKEELIKQTLKELIETLPLSEITVQKICKESGIKRQTFYYHFTSIYDVLIAYFLSERIENIESASNWSALVHVVLAYAGKNRQLILKTLKSDAADAVESFFYNNLYKKGRQFIVEKYQTSLDKNDINEVAKLISDSLAREISRLLVNPQELSISAIEENISKTFDGMMDLICENKKNKGRKKA